MEELEKFKREINLAEFAQLYGYRIDKDKSSRSVKQLRNDNTGDKIVVSQYDNGHYVYFSMHDDRDNGTIIDFIQNRTGKNLGQVRKELRTYLIHREHQVEPVQMYKGGAERPKIYQVWSKIKTEKPKKRWRGISPKILQKAIDADRLKIFDGAYYFKILDLNGMCGIEKRTDGKKRVIKGSQKGLWAMGNIKRAETIIIAESPVDALSYLELKGMDPDKVYVLATMGAMNKKAKESLAEIAKRSNAKWIIATDADKGGENIAKEVMEVIGDGINVERERPPTEKDWNDELLAELERNKKGDRKAMRMQ